MERVKLGDTPGPAICAEAVYKTADLFRENCPQAGDLLKKSSYVDDSINSSPVRLMRWTQLNKWRTYSPKEDSQSNLDSSVEKQELTSTIVKQRTCYRWECREVRPGLVMLKGSNENIRVLGLGWNPKSDNVVFGITLNFSKTKRGVRTGPNLVEVNLPQVLPDILSRQIVLEQVMRIYDPLGLVHSFTLIAKVYLWKTWSRILEWDNRLPDDLCT